MKFVVYSRATMMAANPPEKPWALISICEKGDFPEVHENEFLQGRLNLKFHDIDAYKNGEPENETRILFDDSHAKTILDFYEDMNKAGTSVIYVHCLMGQCRSAAVAAALEKALNGDDAKYFGRGPYRPNMRVYRGVLNECFDRGLLE
jgi:predicted protein tyrosine phosphatase